MDIYDPYYICDAFDYDLYGPYCIAKAWAFMILIAKVKADLKLGVCIVARTKDDISSNRAGLRSSLHIENMEIYDPYYIFDPFDCDLHGPYCTEKLWAFMILITSIILLTMPSMVLIIFLLTGLRIYTSESKAQGPT